MHLDRSVTMNNRCHSLVYSIFHQKINELLSYRFIQTIGIIFKLWKYFLIIFNIYDIVPRAANVYRDKIPIPQLEQINITIKHTRINLFDNVSKVRSVTIAIVSQKVNSAVQFLLCKNLKGGDVYD